MEPIEPPVTGQVTPGSDGALESILRSVTISGVVAVAVLLIAMVICLFAMVLSLTFDCWWTLGDLLHFSSSYNAQERELLASKSHSNSQRSSTHSTIINDTGGGSNNYGYQPMLDRYLGEMDEEEAEEGGPTMRNSGSAMVTTTTTYPLLRPSERDGEMPPEFAELYAPDWCGTDEGDRSESPPSTWVLRLQKNGRVGNVRAEACDLMDVEDMI